MKHVTVFLLFFLSLGESASYAKKAAYDWQKGTLVESTRYPRPCYVSDCREFVGGQRFVIDAGDYYLTAEHPMIRRPDVTVNGPIEFAVKKGTIWIRDERGRVFEMKVIRKELK